jgi:hypothetical protein
VAKAKKSGKAVLEEVTSEMAKPHITASARKAIHPESGRQRRKLVLIHQGSFHNYACSWCGCRFGRTKIPDGISLFEILLVSKLQREKQFADHLCSDR